ncbi:hypothetical protein G3R49_00900 [Shewanella sp. WXL01]|uniref:PepSY-associated TM helix domain-containing protein n=1 Tax=Shewanella sp. WXL01 TaxID=2709721 RepID=UPI00143852CE|nr:PepSY-associated TM helix domain-containing protein [Shewanella sp. WXL01]NKF49133.1 hypothetical protein [Shewanella sp. WXL01]
MKWFNNINWYRLNRTLHRDIGYFCIGFSIIFAVSGIAVNHIADWNPNYAVERQIQKVDDSDWLTLEDRQIAMRMKQQFSLTHTTKSSFWQNKNKFEVFLEDGDTLLWDRKSSQVVYQDIEPRVILQALNKLHLNETRNAWVYFSDLFAGMLIFLALSALFMVKGKHGPAKPKSIILMGLGVVIPIFFLMISS